MATKAEIALINAQGDSAYWIDQLWESGADPDDFRCEACGGDGYVNAQEYYCDWINESSGSITCPKCGGYGDDHRAILAAARVFAARTIRRERDNA